MPPAAAAPGRVLLLGIDGSEPAEVQAPLDEGALPNLASLRDAGAWHDLVFSDHAEADGTPPPTVTKPGWSQIFTGLPWEKTGVRSNERWAGPTPAGLTRPEQRAQSGAPVGWVVSKRHPAARDRGDKGPFWNVFRIKGACTAYKPGASMKGLVGTARKCLDRFRARNRWFPVVHFRNPDIVGHEYGPGSKQYRKALVEVDTAIGDLLPAMPPGTQIVAISDHGFCDWSRVDGFHHHACPQTWGIASPALALGSRLLDVAPLLRP